MVQRQHARTGRRAHARPVDPHTWIRSRSAAAVLGVISQTDAIGTTHSFRGPDGIVLGQKGPDGKSWFYLSDHLGSTTALIDATGARVNSFGYGPYGEHTYCSDLTNQPKVYWKYTGAYRDGESVSDSGRYKLAFGTTTTPPDASRNPTPPARTPTLTCTPAEIR